eukprot:4112193-Amphidinium_carterae.1
MLDGVVHKRDRGALEDSRGPSGEMIKGFAVAPVLSQEEPEGVEGEQVANLVEAGWRRVALEVQLRMVQRPGFMRRMEC